MKRRCSYFECMEPARGKTDLCNGHRLQLERGKKLHKLKSQVTGFERFLEKIDFSSPDLCWNWTGGYNRDGYAIFQLRPITDKAYKAAFFFSNGYLPARPWIVDHKCRNRRCVNPGHLRVATYSENAQNRALNSNNKSGFPGVVWRPEVSKWRVRVGLNGRYHHLGHFSELEKAISASRNFRLRNHPFWEDSF